jgi:hypothetical protein
VGRYEFPADNLNWLERKIRTWRQGGQLIAQFVDKDKSYGAFNICPESETNFFAVNSGLQFSFIRNDKGETTALILHPGQGFPDSEGKKVENE